MTSSRFASIVPPVGPAAAAPIGGRRTSLLRLFGNASAGGEAPWECPIDDALPTLEEAFRDAPPELGFNLELKIVEAKTPGPAEMKEILLSVLQACERSSNGRRLFFSSFDPDAALLMRRLQSRWPVMLLTDAAGDPGSEWEVHADPRRNGVRAAVATALQGGLAGIVTDSAPLFASPELVNEVRGTGLLLATWGRRNNDPGAVRTQAEWGVCALITDAVSRSVEALRADGEERAGPPRRAAAAAAATATVRSAVAALPAFLGGGGSIPEEILRQHPLKDIQFTSDAADVRSVFDAAGNVGVRQKPLPEDRSYGEPLTRGEVKEQEQKRAAAAVAASAAAGVAARAQQGRAHAAADCKCVDGVICHTCVFASATHTRPRQGPSQATSPSAAAAAAAAADAANGTALGGMAGAGSSGMGVQARAPTISAPGGSNAAGAPLAARRPAGRFGLAQLLQSPRLWMV